MKTSLLKLSMIALLAITSISCSKSDDAAAPVVTPPPVVGANTGDLKLFVIDTAKVNTITMTGTNETTILNRKVNLNSYIGSMSLNSDASKFAYVDNQSSFANGVGTYTKTVRVANANGTGDVAIYTAPANTNTVTNDIGFVKFGTSKIYFTTTTQTSVGGALATSVKLNSTNFDGTGLVAENYNAAPLSVYNSDVSSNGRFLATMQSAPNIPKFLLIDRTGDNGAGSVVFQENLPTTPTANVSNAVISFDDKFAYYSFVENQAIKVKIVNLTNFTAVTKTIATGFTPTSYLITMSIGSDNNRGIVVVDSYDNAPTKSYVFNLANSTSTTFDNNDKTIAYIKAF